MDTLMIEVPNTWPVLAGIACFIGAVIALVVFAVARDGAARRADAKLKSGSTEFRERKEKWIADVAGLEAELGRERAATKREREVSTMLLGLANSAMAVASEFNETLKVALERIAPVCHLGTAGEFRRAVLDPEMSGSLTMPEPDVLNPADIPLARAVLDGRVCLTDSDAEEGRVWRFRDQRSLHRQLRCQTFHRHQAAQENARVPH